MTQGLPAMDYSVGARISQIAKVRGVETHEVIRELQPSVGVMLNASSWMDKDHTAAALEGVTPRRDIAEVTPLIRNAFRIAQESGKADWSTMSLPVLKNRLLDLSGGTFDESDYGAPNMGALARAMPDVLVLSEGRPHEKVTLIAEPARETPGISSQRNDERAKLRLRNDLWQATMDFSSRTIYLWDEAQGRARPGVEGEAGTLPFPTITYEELAEWRGEFAQSVASLQDQDLIASWVEKGLATAALPPAARGAWNAFLKDHAEERLRAFFLANGIDIPADLMSDGQRVELDSQSRLRRLLHAVIDQMSEEELQALTIPVGVLTRVRW